MNELELIEHNILECQACTARASATKPVPGRGEKTGIVFVGRNPGIDEDRKGEPFIGEAGRVLDDFLVICGIRRSDVFITNIVN